VSVVVVKFSLLERIIIISPLQSTAGHRPLQFLAISLDLRLLASSSCQPLCPNRHSTWPGGVLHYVYRDGLHSRTRLPQRLSVLQLIWPAHCHFSMLTLCAISVTLVFCRITWLRAMLKISLRNGIRN
jgi:hypothetical protein